MSAPVLRFDPEQLADIPVVGDGEESDPVRIVVWCAHLTSIKAEKEPVKEGFSDYVSKNFKRVRVGC